METWKKVVVGGVAIVFFANALVVCAGLAINRWAKDKTYHVT
jgi:hypothetical protein